MDTYRFVAAAAVAAATIAAAGAAAGAAAAAAGRPALARRGLAHAGAGDVGGGVGPSVDVDVGKVRERHAPLAERESLRVRPRTSVIRWAQRQFGDQFTTCCT